MIGLYETFIGILQYICPALFFLGAVDWIVGAIGRRTPDLIENIEQHFFELFELGRVEALIQAPLLVLKPLSEAVIPFTRNRFSPGRFVS